MGEAARAWAVARFAAHRAGGWRPVVAVAAATLAGALAGGAIPGPTGAGRADAIAAAALLAATLGAGLAAAVGGASALGVASEWIAVAASPARRATLLGGALAGVLGCVALALVGGAAVSAACVTAAGGGARPATRWAEATIAGGSGADAGGVTWTTVAERPVEVAFAGLAAAAVPDGPLEIRLRPRLLRRPPESAGHEGHAHAPILDVMEAPALTLACVDAAGATTPLEPPGGGPWHIPGPAGLRIAIPRERCPADGTLRLRVTVPAAGLRVGLAPDGARVALRPASRPAACARAVVAMFPACALVALVAAGASTRTRRGVALLAGVGMAAVLALAPIAREAATLVRPGAGLASLASEFAAVLLAVLPRSAGVLEACAAGDDVAWASVAAAILAHGPIAAVAVAAAAVGLWRRDW